MRRERVGDHTRAAEGGRSERGYGAEIGRRPSGGRGRVAQAGLAAAREWPITSGSGGVGCLYQGWACRVPDESRGTVKLID